MCRTVSNFFSTCGHVTSHPAICPDYPTCPWDGHFTVPLPTRCPECTQSLSQPRSQRSSPSSPSRNQTPRALALAQLSVAVELAREASQRLTYVPEPNPRAVSPIGPLALRRRAHRLRLLGLLYMRDGSDGFTVFDRFTVLQQHRMERVRDALRTLGQHENDTISVRLDPIYASRLDGLIELVLTLPGHGVLERAMPDMHMNPGPSEQTLRIRGLEGFLVRAGEGQGEDMCCICREEFGKGGEERVGLPCGHVFGETCIGRWLVERPNCPMCRREYAWDLAEIGRDVLLGERGWA